MTINDLGKTQYKLEINSSNTDAADGNEDRSSVKYFKSREKKRLQRKKNIIKHKHRHNFKLVRRHIRSATLVMSALQSNKEFYSNLEKLSKVKCNDLSFVLENTLSNFELREVVSNSDLRIYKNVSTKDSAGDCYSVCDLKLKLASEGVSELLKRYKKDEHVD